jgi:putative spermidine/putrescine transport system permease protein
MATPFFIILFSNLYHNERLDEYATLAATLGAKHVYVARKVIIPVLLYRSFATLVLYFVFILSSYEIPLLLGSQSRQMISVLTIQKLQRFNLNDIPQAYAISVLYGIIVIISVASLLKNKRVVKDYR